jgi:energy-coupling factor transporter ATP-binding protein EcfA2
MITVNNSCTDYKTYRSARVKSLFNVESGADFTISVDVPSDDEDWSLGVIVGPSGSGKTSIGSLIWEDTPILDLSSGWGGDAPIVEDILPDGEFDTVTGALSAVGLGSVPSWLRPFRVLSGGEQFRAGLARVIAEMPERVIIDEFTSVVDRQIAKIGAAAFAKAWRRTGGRAVLLSCHYDILDWLEPDWVVDMGTGKTERGRLRRRPRIQLDIFKADGTLWPLFEPHHYLKVPRMIAAEYYIGAVDGELVSHIAVAPALHYGGMRACRMVVMPEWQGAGVGMRFLNEVTRLQFTASNKYHERVRQVNFHTSHPGLAAALRRDKHWEQNSSWLGGKNAKHCFRGTMNRGEGGVGMMAKYGGHFRAVQGFRSPREAHNV